MQPMRHDAARAMRLAARGLGRHGLAHAYGHVSVRTGERSFLVSPPQPLATVPPGDPGVAVELDAALPDRALPEVRIHREVYRRRGDVAAICRFQSPAVMALSALGETPRALHGLGSYFVPYPPIWMETTLVREDRAAIAVAGLLSEARAIVLRGNGAVTVGGSMEEAAALAFFLEDAARIELALLSSRAAGVQPHVYTAEEAAARAIGTGALFERMWQFLCFGDPEWQ